MKLAELFTEAEYKKLKRQIYLRRFFLLGAAIFVLGMAMTLLAVIPQVFSDLDLRVRLQQEKDRATQLSDKMAALQQLAAANDSKTEHEVELALPSSKPLLSLLTSVSAAAQTAKVGISKINTAPGALASSSAQTTASTSNTGTQIIPPAVDTTASTDDLAPNERRNVQTLNISLIASGTLSQINAFIQALEQSTPLMNISKIALAPQDSSVDVTSPTAQFQAKLNITTYYFIQPITATVDDPLPEVGATGQQFLTNLQTFTFPSEAQTQTTIQGGGLNDLFGQLNGTPGL